jgi:hypothetical protein
LGSEISTVAKDTFAYASGTFAAMVMSSETLEEDLHLKEKLQAYLPSVTIHIGLYHEK